MPSVTYGFLGNPKALQIFTSSNYTIPAGEYAYVTIQVKPKGTVQLDGTAVLSAANTVAVQANGSSNTNIYTGPTVGYADATLTLTGTMTVSIGGQTVATGASSQKVIVGPSQVVAISGYSSGTAYLAGAEMPLEVNNTASYWVPTGTVINISSTPAQVVVQRFDA